MVFQTYALYPHMTVRQNLGYGLKARKTAKAEIARRVEEVAQLLGLADLLERRPAQLSGGQRQRVAMGRAIAREPQAFLLDEPLSNLDAKLRVGMRASLAQLHRRLGVTTVYVTHDQVEAMTLGQRVAVMRAGKILQVDTPKRLYLEPRDIFVAGFIGSPAMNLVEATVEDGHVHFGQFSLPVPPRAATARRPRDPRDPPRELRGRRARAPTCRRSRSSSRCSRTSAPTRTSSSPSRRARSRPRSLEADDEERLARRSAAPSSPPASALRTAAAVGERVSLAVDPQRLQFFHPETGLAPRADARRAHREL